MPKSVQSILKGIRRLTVFVIGTGVLTLGLVLIPLPGPGFLVVILGLAILATEFPWAQTALDIAQQRAQKSRNAVRQRWRQRRGVVDELPERRHGAADERALGG
jgi:uncharacterized protein (TIGR02611 family)